MSREDTLKILDEAIKTTKEMSSEDFLAREEPNRSRGHKVIDKQDFHGMLCGLEDIVDCTHIWNMLYTDKNEIKHYCTECGSVKTILLKEAKVPKRKSIYNFIKRILESRRQRVAENKDAATMNSMIN